MRTVAAMTVLLRDIVDPALIDAAIDARLIDIRPSADGSLLILNYSRRAQYQNVWDGATVVCRGLIVEGPGPLRADTVVRSRAFNKFFTIAQHDALAAAGALAPLPASPFEVLDKVDGALGVCYVAPDGRPAIATRGSFTSPQATWATAHLRSHPELEAGAATILTAGTPCFEIICEASRVVIDYPFEDLILLAVTDVATGAARPELEAAWPGRVIGRHTNLGAYRDLSSLAWADSEGFVIRFADGTLAKTKFAEYLRLHKLITGVSPLLLWENVATGHLRDTGVNEASTVSRLGVSDKLVHAIYATGGDPMAAYLDGLPDEYDAWVRTTIAGLWADFEVAKADAAKLVAGVPPGPRKEQAAWVNAHVAGRWRGIVFAALDGNDVSAQLWRTLRPTETGGPWGALAA